MTEETEVERRQPERFKKYLTAKHKEDLLWFDALMEARSIPNEPYGYDEIYGNDLDRYNEIRYSKDYEERYRPDRRLEIDGAPILAEIKAKRGFLPAIGLMLNAKRPLRVFYIIERREMATAIDLVSRQKEYFAFLRFYNRKKGYEEIEPQILSTFEALGKPERTSDPTGWDGEKYVSGDPCVCLRSDAPLSSFEGFWRASR